jgi:hypothetical protein
MAETAVVHIGENSPEEVALKLMYVIDTAEKHPTRTRQQILDLYAECLRAVTHPHLRAGSDRTGQR